MVPLNHEIFITILKYSTLCDLVKLIILSKKKCVDTVQDEVNRKYIAHSLIKPCVSGDNRLFIPLQFWFNYNKGFALPSIVPQNRYI